jgi:hypothetical protein
VVFEIAQRGGEAFAAREKVFVDPQHLRAPSGMPFSELPLQSTLEVAFHSGGPDSFSPGYTAPVDSIQMIPIDHPLKRFRRTLTWQYTRKPVPEVPLAGPALPFAGFQLQNAAPHS